MCPTFTPNIAAELVLTYPQKHDRGAVRRSQIGSLKHLPPMLLAQYHFTNFGAFKPYVGAGANYTRFSSVSFDPAAGAALNPLDQEEQFSRRAADRFRLRAGQELVAEFRREEGLH
ncbi:Inhibitor of nuclear factor kappa-B kinase subunit alpha [Manis javanica]|nr:Inhibitor of nuclear factor kappa-B kinase subunit alpha [Manis javanica]